MIPKVWYPARNSHSGPIVSKIAEAHIVYRGNFLCGGDPKKIIKKEHADKGVIRLGVIPGNPMCEECQRIYRSSPDFPYHKWANGE